VYAREASEPILKPGEATEALLKAVTASVEAPEKVPTYEVRSPVGAVEIADYLWNEAYPKGATPAVALELFADDIRYEDFNYPKPFLGKAEAFRRAEMPRVERSFSSSIVSSTRVERDQIPQVKAFVEAFDIPGIEFVPTELSGGDDAVCFTWKVLGLCFDEVSSTRVEESKRIRLVQEPFENTTISVVDFCTGRCQRQRRPKGRQLLRVQRRGQGRLHPRHPGHGSRAPPDARGPREPGAAEVLAAAERIKVW